MADIPTSMPVGAHRGGVGDRIVVGVDGSPAAECALLWAADDAAQRHGVLEVVHCWQAAPAITPGAVALSDDVGYLLEGAGQELVDAAARGARVRDCELQVTAHLINGDPGPSLVAFADGAALLVVGRRGLGRISRLLLGSVSSYCAAHARCAVAVVPQPMENELSAEQIRS